jgi:hypothetical protein
MRLKRSKEVGTKALGLIVYMMVGHRLVFCDQNVEHYFRNGQVE